MKSASRRGCAFGLRGKSPLWCVIPFVLGACGQGATEAPSAAQAGAGGEEATGSEVTTGPDEATPRLGLEAADPLTLTLLSPDSVVYAAVSEIVADPLIGEIVARLLDSAEEGQAEPGNREALAISVLRLFVENCAQVTMSGTERRGQGGARPDHLWVMNCPTGATGLADMVADLTVEGRAGQSPEQVGEGPDGLPILRYAPHLEGYFDGHETFVFGSRSAPASLLSRWAEGTLARVPIVVQGLSEEPLPGTVGRFVIQNSTDGASSMNVGGVRVRISPGSLMSGGVTLGDAGLGVAARAAWPTAPPAAESLARLETLRRELSDHIVMLMMGLTPVLQSAELRQEGNAVVMNLTVPRATLQVIWGLLSAQLAAQSGAAAPSGQGPGQ